MTARQPLFEFMPYGAPELLAFERPHLLRALALASSLALAAFILARPLGLSLPSRPIVVPVVPACPHFFEPPPSITELKPHLPVPVIPTPPAGPAYPIPVEEAMTSSPVPERFDAGAPADVGAGAFVDPATIPTGPVAGFEEPPPDRGTWVYTDEMPVAVKIVKPIYPDLARDLGIEGPVYVHLLVGKDGRVVRAEVDEQIEVPMLNEAALTAARQWVFKPALANEHPVMVWVAERFTFKLH